LKYLSGRELLTIEVGQLLPLQRKGTKIMIDPMTVENATVTTGAVLINHVVQVIDHDDVKVWLVDAKTKYATYFGYVDANTKYATPPAVLLAVGEDTRGVNPENPRGHTRIELGLPPEGGDWTILVDGGRYEWRIVAYRVAAE
jgi:hypothetical protein